MMSSRTDPTRIPHSWTEACRLGYFPHLTMWVDGSNGYESGELSDLITMEAKWLDEFEKEGPFDDVWEAEFFQALVELLPENEQLHEAAPGTYSAVLALAVAGAIVVKSDNAGLLEDPQLPGEFQVLFFIVPEGLQRVRRAAETAGLAVRQAHGMLWSLTGRSLGVLPAFAHQLSTAW